MEECLLQCSLSARGSGVLLTFIRGDLSQGKEGVHLGKLEPREGWWRELKAQWVSTSRVRGHLGTSGGFDHHFGFDLGWDWEEKDRLGVWGGAAKSMRLMGFRLNCSGHSDPSPRTCLSSAAVLFCFVLNTHRILDLLYCLDGAKVIYRYVSDFCGITM